MTSLKFLFSCLLGGAMLLSISCSAESPAPPTTTAQAAAAVQRDPHSFAHPDEVAVKHLSLDLGVDFQQQKLAGTASLTIDNKSGAKQLWLDTRDLDVKAVTLGPEKRATTFKLQDEVPIFGSALVIDIAPDTKVVNVEYSTSPKAAALQWLSPEQTAGKKHPFLLSQSQAILARTWIPLQDTPTVRMTYDAKIRVPRELMAVMSAENSPTRNESGAYEFRMPQAIPSYLMALAVGDLAFRKFDERSGVYAEPSVVEKADWEFADLPKMIAAAEKLYGPYQWGRYDLLVLPPSFPFGGMENPRLTFATPTILAGDRSLVALVAHELAHSWSGNLVTNATWNDFWLNEGFTTYFTQRIMEAVYGREYSEMLALLSMQDLQTEVKNLNAANKPADTHLYLNLTGRDPDDGATDIAYEKGYYFLRLLEESVGREEFDEFLKGYFKKFAFQSMTTDKFLEYLRAELLNKHPGLEGKLRIKEWIYGPGVPSNAPQARSAAFTKVEGELKRLASGTPAAQLATKGWSTHEWMHFIRNLPTPISRERLSELDRTFRFTDSGNSEIAAAWFEKAIPNNYEPAYPALERFLTEMGRRKFLKPLYTELAKSDEGRKRALRIYAKARPGYHTVSRQTIDEILKWDVSGGAPAPTPAG